MSGVFQTLFGGSRQSSTSTSAPTDVTPAPFKALQRPFADVLGGLISGGASNPLGGVPTYTGPTTAPVTAPEQSLLTNLSGQAGGVGSGLLADTIAGRFTDPNTNPYLTAFIQAAQRPTLQRLEETLSRVLPGRFTAAGHFTQPQGSSAFDTAAATATRGAAQAMGDIATNIGANAYNTERGFQQQGIQLGQQEVATTIQNLQAQALPRLIQQYGLDVGLQQFRDRISALLSILGVTTNVTHPVTGQTSTSTATGSQTPGIIPTLLSPFRIAGSVGNLFSS